LLEPPDRGAALLYVDKSHALLTINFRGELYLARRIDVGLDQLSDAASPGHDDGLNRILLELQRSFDHLDRQFPFVGVAKLVLAPTPSDTGLQTYLGGNLDIPVEAVHLGQVLSLEPGVELEGERAWRLFHLLGAALRHDGDGA
jgi:MSHA biogenesis protein MshI